MAYRNPEEWRPNPVQAEGGSAHTDLMRPIRGQPSRAQARARITTPIAPKVMAEWRKTDPRPTPVTFYDGAIDHKRLSLSTAAPPDWHPELGQRTPEGYPGLRLCS